MKKNNVKQAWTIAEMVVSMLVLAVLIGLSVQVIKPNKIRKLPFGYASIKNLEDAGKYVLKEVGKMNMPDNNNDGSDFKPDGTNKENRTCYLMADAFSLVQVDGQTYDYNCKVGTTSTHTKPNFQTSNLISYWGLEQPFKTGADYVRGTATSSNECATVEVGMKDVIVDLDGPKNGENRLGIDIFPLKMFSTGEVFPGTCVAISGNNTPSACAGKSFSKKNFPVAPSSVCNLTGLKKNYMLENHPFAYTVYKSRIVNAEELATGNYKKDDRITEVVKAEISFAEADCIARNNILTRSQCESLGYRPIHEEYADGSIKNSCIDSDSFCIIRQTRPLSMNLFALPF